MNNVLIDINSTLFSQISQEAHGFISAEYRPAFTLVSTLALGDIVYADTFEKRMDYFEELAELLILYSQISTYTVSFPNGELFTVGKFGSEVRHIHHSDLNAPAEASFFIISTDNKNPSADNTSFYNQQLKKVGATHHPHNKFHVSHRPWFDQSIKKHTKLSRPHYFSTIEQFGLTIHRMGENGAIVSSNILLSNISSALKNTAKTPSSLRVLYDKTGTVYAMNKPYDLKASPINNQGHLININNLKNNSISSSIKSLDVDGDIKEYTYNGQVWFGQIFSISVRNNENLYLLVATKGSEMLQPASVIRHYSILLSLAVLIIAIPCAHYISKKISRPIREATQQALDISRFDFPKSATLPTHITEIHYLNHALSAMRSAIQNYLTLTDTISKQDDFDELVKFAGRSTAEATGSNAAYLYLANETKLEPKYAWRVESQSDDINQLAEFSLNDKNIQQAIKQIMDSNDPFTSAEIDRLSQGELQRLNLTNEQAWTLTFPLFNRKKETIGAMVLIFEQSQKEQILNNHLHYFESLTHYTAIALDGRRMFEEQKLLLEAFIKVMAGAIDTKSPYTSNHCQKVPLLTQWFAQAAIDSTQPEFKDFDLSKDGWEELRIAAWLHDCGKVTTPEHIIDKSSKLETIYNRIHEIRTRFEVLKREVEIEQWRKEFKQLSSDAQTSIDNEWQRLDNEFAFIAHINTGGEYQSPEQIARVKEIGRQQWLRTMDNQLGLSWEELERIPKSIDSSQPQMESLLEDKPDHLIPHIALKPQEERFNIKAKEYSNNLGELYNLTIATGTLNDEERYVINAHITETIRMLEALPFPREIKNIPTIAGGHHEKVDGTGYPLGLTGDEMPLTTKMMTICDVFEALTSSERPYKKAKTLSESIKIMHFMVKDNHIDRSLFELFLTSGVYKKYALAHLKPEQCDDVDLALYLAKK
ncbi:phosphohydrolase [Vibrio sp. 10N.286.49.B3]|nr:phosphohydrolase [Vibrio sp. 10N.286.49.B3]